MVRYDTQAAIAPTPNGDVTLDIRDAVATITVERPSKINAMRLATWQALYTHVVAADSNPAVGVIVVRGSGKHFGAGNDIAALSTFPGNLADAREFATAWANGIQAVEDASKPVLMAIEGVCYGAALALSLAGDVRIASTSAVFSIPVAKLGALYLRSDFQRLVATIGMGQSKKLIYSSEVFGAEQALRIGLVDALFTEDHFNTEVQRLVETILTRSPYTLLRSKRMLREIGSGDVLRETSESLAAFAESTQCADFAEGVSAFLTRRNAHFR
ncbi:MAG: enoyl-CoA hydratase/isomerase family protein [Pseudomonadota bacterium]